MDSHDFEDDDPIPVWGPNRSNTPTSNTSSHSDNMTTDMVSHDFGDDGPIPVLAETAGNTPTDDISSTSNSAEKVFAIAELADMICLKLDDGDTTPASRISTAIVDLFNLQRVSKTFKAAIESSKKLQRVMLLSYDGEDALERPFGLEFLLNGPLGHERFHPALPCGIEHPGLGGVRVVRLIWRRYNLGEKFDDDAEGYYGCDCHGLGSDWAAVHERFHGSMRALARAALKHHFSPEASWRRMKMSSRPREIHVQLIIRPKEPMITWDHTAILSPTETLGALFHTIQRVLSRSESELNEMRERVVYLVRYFLNVRYRSLGDEDLHLQASERLHEMKREHDKLADCGVSRGVCFLCSAFHAFRYSQSVQLLPHPHDQIDDW